MDRLATVTATFEGVAMPSPSRCGAAVQGVDALSVADVSDDQTRRDGA